MNSLLRKRKIVKTAIYSRLFVIILQYLFNHLVADHDAGVFLYPKDNTTELFADEVIHHLFGGFLRWDAQYFMHIAKYGYTYENVVAFFPLFPLLGTVFGKCVFWLNVVGIDSILLVVFLILNLLFFVYSALTLFELGNKLFPEKIAYYSTLLFCWNPASVFFTAPYTECLFSLLSYKAMLNCILLHEKYFNLRRRIVVRDILYLLPIALSGITRSNGIVNIGFFLYMLACVFLQNFITIKGNVFMRYMKKLTLTLAFTIITIFSLIFCLFPFDLFQIYCYKLFCSNFTGDIPYVVEKYAKEKHFVLLGTFSEHNSSWCHNRFPLAYSYVQDHYWNVGFLKYYELKQIPNFFLAAPILIIFLHNCKEYLLKNGRKSLLEVFSFDLSQPKSNSIFENPLLFVYIIHGLFLSIFCILFIHIQVTTRFLCSSSPLLYWFSAYHMIENGKFCDIRDFKRFPFKRKFIILYYLTYFTVGIALFCNFLPWT